MWEASFCGRVSDTGPSQILGGVFRGGHRSWGPPILISNIVVAGAGMDLVLVGLGWTLYPAEGR